MRLKHILCSSPWLNDINRQIQTIINICNIFSIPSFKFIYEGQEYEVYAAERFEIKKIISKDDIKHIEILNINSKTFREIISFLLQDVNLLT